MEPGLCLLTLDLPGEKNAVTQSALHRVLGPGHPYLLVSILTNPGSGGVGVAQGGGLGSDGMNNIGGEGGGGCTPHTCQSRIRCSA